MKEVLGKKISFCDAQTMAERIKSGNEPINDEEALEALEIIGAADSVDEIEYAFALLHGCLAVRMLDESGYSFLYPFMLSEDADPTAVVSDLLKYAVLEELDPVIHDVPREGAAQILKIGLWHMRIDVESSDGERLCVRIDTSLGFAQPGLVDPLEGMWLDRLCASDADAYHRLLSDPVLNKYWGYDYREDYGELDGEELIALSEKQCENEKCVILALRSDADELVGEITFYHPDGKGGAELAIRLLPEHQGKGYSRVAFSLSRDYALELGLAYLYAHICKENITSISAFSRYASSIDEGDETVRLVFDLYED